MCVGMVFLALSQGRLCPSRCGLVHFQGFLLSQPARGCWKLHCGLGSGLGSVQALWEHPLLQLALGWEPLNAGNVTGGGQGLILGKDGGDGRAESLWQPWLTHPVLCLAVSSGSVTVHADSTVQVLAEEAVTMDMLDLAVSTQRFTSPGLPPWRGFAPFLCSGVLVSCLGSFLCPEPRVVSAPPLHFGIRGLGLLLVNSLERGSSAVINLHAISHPLDRH